MIHDLLYKVKENISACDALLADDLMINRIFARFFTDYDKLQTFIKMLCSPLKDEQNINYRKEIITEFHKNPELLSKTKNMLYKIKELYDDINSKRIQRAANSPLLLLKMRAEALKMLLELFADIAPIAKGLSSSNSTIKGMLERIAQIGDDTNNRAFIQYCDEINNISMDGAHFVEIELDEHGKVHLCELTDADVPIQTEQTSTRKSIFSKPAQPQIVAVPLDYIGFEDAKTFYTASINTLSELFHDTQSAIFTEFLTAAEQIDFIIVAVEIIKIAQESKIEWCFAQFSNNNEIEIIELRDLLLSVNGAVPISNDITCLSDINGIVITGGNNSGKTVFLRSFAISMLMAYQGLPILAKHAIVPLKNGIYSLFASSERTLAQNMGRFEQEVERLSKIIDEITPSHILVLNEPFQTTEYTEGAEGLYHILNFLSKNDIFWIIVTHLTHLGELYKNQNNVLKLKMGEDHKFEQ